MKAGPATRQKPARTRGTSEAEIRMQAILNTAVDGIIVIDEDGTIESFNPAAEKIFGYSAKEILGQNINLLMPEPHKSKHASYVQQYLRTGKARIIGIGRETLALHKNGTTFPIDLSVSEVMVGKRRTFTGLVRDISERKRLEQAIVDASEMERMQIGQDLHDTVSQQLAGLTMITQVLQKKIQQMDEDLATELTPEAGRIADLASTALKQVKNISHGLYPVELERNGLGSALEELVNRQEDLFGVPCEYNERGPCPKLSRTCAVHLYRIAQEAVSNAIKHARAKRIQVCLEGQRRMLKLCVRYDGIGISRTQDSSGLGLAIMEYRANMLGAEFKINTPAGGGTRVQCTLPLKLNEENGI